MMNVRVIQNLEHGFRKDLRHDKSDSDDFEHRCGDKEEGFRTCSLVCSMQSEEENLWGVKVKKAEN